MDKKIEFVKTGIMSINAHFDPEDPEFCSSVELDRLNARCVKKEGNAVEKQWQKDQILPVRRQPAKSTAF